MCPEKARVFVVENHPRDSRNIERVLNMGGHEVVLFATNLNDALAGARRLKDLKVSVAILDRNLTPGKFDGTDGEKVLQAIKEEKPDVITFGMSTDPFDNTDFDIGKMQMCSLADAVTNA